MALDSLGDHDHDPEFWNYQPELPPETYAPVLLQRKARRLRLEAKN
jgi:hypothetical protein